MGSVYPLKQASSGGSKKTSFYEKRELLEGKGP